MKTITGIISCSLILAVISTATAAEFIIREYPDRFVVEYDGSSDAKPAPSITQINAPRPAPVATQVNVPRPAPVAKRTNEAELEQLLQMSEESRDKSKPVTESDGAAPPTLAYSSTQPNISKWTPPPPILSPPTVSSSIIQSGASPTSSPTLQANAPMAPSPTIQANVPIIAPPPAIQANVPIVVPPPAIQANVPIVVPPPTIQANAPFITPPTTEAAVSEPAPSIVAAQDQPTNRMADDSGKIVISRVEAWMKRLQFMKELNQKAIDAKKRQ